MLVCQHGAENRQSNGVLVASFAEHIYDLHFAISSCSVVVGMKLKYTSDLLMSLFEHILYADSIRRYMFGM